MILLGSTGSIGVNTLLIAERYSIPVETLVAGNNIELLNEQISRFKPRRVVVADEKRCHEVNHPEVYCGEEGILQAIESSESDLVVNALVGFLGLRPTLKTLELGKTLALANKESLVVAGQFIDPRTIRPIDSEHFGLWYLLSDKPIKKMYLTASGGAFRDADRQTMENATLSDVLKHPNWSMGQKITIDSATMVNKLFEVLEARWLFGLTEIYAIIEPRSIIHAMIEFADGSLTAHLAHADMKLPIAYALLGKVQEEIIRPVDLLQLGNLEFRSIETERYPVWELCQPLLEKPESGVVLNAANEAAMTLFLENKIPFTGISERILEAYAQFEGTMPRTLEDVFAIDSAVRRWVSESV